MSDHRNNERHIKEAHKRARMLIVLSDSETSAAEQSWLREHLAECESCSHFAETARQAVAALRSTTITARASLVTATQLRVRRRALELQRHRERMWVIGVCCFAVTLGSAITVAALWGGFTLLDGVTLGGLTWTGQRARLSDPLWQIALIAVGVMPAVVVGIVMLARGTYMADHNGTFQG